MRKTQYSLDWRRGYGLMDDSPSGLQVSSIWASAQRDFADLAETIHFEVCAKSVVSKVGDPGPSRCFEKADGEPLFVASVTDQIHAGEAQLDGAEARIRVILGKRRFGTASASDSDVQ